MKRCLSYLPVILLMLAIMPHHSLFARDMESQKVLNDQYKREAYDHLYPEISQEVLAKAIKANQVFLIDANSEKTYKEGHLPTALSLTNPQLLEKNMPVLKGYPVVVYCYSSQCNAWHNAANFAQSKGYNNIMHFKDGLKGWRAAGGAVEKAAAK